MPPAGGTGIASTYLNAGLAVRGPFGSGGYFHAGGFGGLALSEEGASWASLLAGGGWLQPLSSTLSLGIAALGEAFTVGDPVPYQAAYAEAEPEVRLQVGGTGLRLGGYGGIGVSEVTTIEVFIRDTRFGPRLFEVGFPVTSDLWAWGGTAELSQQFGVVAARVGAEAYESPQGRYVVGRLGFEANPPGGTFYLEGSLWDTPDGQEAVVAGGVRVRTGARSTIQATGGRYGPSPLLDSPPAGGLGLGATLELARLGPKPELSWMVEGGEPPSLVLSLRAPEARSVVCVGDFTDWAEVAMLRDGDVWRVRLQVTPGAHHFGFLVDGQWYVPPGAPGVVEDDWGEPQATIIVTDPAGRPDVTPDASGSS